MVDSGVTGPFTKAFRKWLNGYSSNIILEPSIITSLGRDFPGGSRNRVSNAGNRVRKDIQTDEDLAVIDTWRESHRHVINSFQALLRNRARNADIFVAQRHKRKRTIFDKLQRYPNMQLGRMDDVAGCRLIFKSVDKLRSFRTEIHAARFKHRLKILQANMITSRTQRMTGIAEFMTFMHMMCNQRVVEVLRAS